MKKLIYIALAAVGASLLGSCNGHKDYENYVETLKAQPAVVDTLSTPQSYAAYVTRYIMLTDSFSRLDIKFDETQAEEVRQLNMKISESLNRRYAELIKAEVAADSAAAPVSDTTAPADTVKP